MHEDRVIKPGGNNRRIYQARGTLSIICELISEPLALLRQGEVIGELADWRLPILPCAAGHGYGFEEYPQVGPRIQYLYQVQKSARSLDIDPQCRSARLSFLQVRDSS